MQDSTRREGSWMIDNAASDSVMECATVKEVATLNTSQNASPKRVAGCQPRPAAASSTEGSNSESRNRMWSKPIQMCHTPSRP